ncbi:winged helix-turn-helix domain-containing protein [Rhizobium mongolense]|uniref:winged helix-turn-helix domain-containing protein n=1 Tax=Rhizobium mongolense TaxID=57676 RepID=UPI0034A544A5
MTYILEQEGFQSLFVEKLDEVVSLAEITQPDLITLSDYPIFDYTWATRQKLFNNARTRLIPVMVLLSEPFHLKRFSTTQMGRTEFLCSPFSPDQFLATLRRLRCASMERRSNVLAFADIVMNLDAHRVYRNSRVVNLGPIEYRLLRHLIARPRQVFSRDELLDAVWGRNIHVVPRTVDVHVSKMRKALTEFGEPDYIRTVRGAGYSLDLDLVLSAHAKATALPHRYYTKD